MFSLQNNNKYCKQHCSFEISCSKFFHNKKKSYVILIELINNLIFSLRLQPKTSQVAKSCAALDSRDPSKYGSPDSE